MGLFHEIRQKIDNGKADFLLEIQWLWQYICRYRFTVLIHILLGVLGILMGLGSSVASKFLIDAVIGYKTGKIGLAAALMIGMQLGNIAMKSMASRVGAVINIRVQNEIQADIYDRILATNWEAVEQFRSGDLLNRLNSDAGTVASGVTSFIPSLISGAVQFLGAFCIILFYDPAMALIALLGVPFSVLGSRLLVRRMRNHNRAMKAIHSDVMSFEEDSFQNLTSIKAFGITELFFEKMAAMQQKYRDTYLDYNRFSVRTSALMSLMGMVVSAACFGWGVFRLWSGVITYGVMTMFLQLASMLGSACSSLIGLVPTAISISTSAGRIMSVVQLPSESPAVEPAFQQERAFSIQLENVHFSYQNGTSVLHAASLTARPGELVALTGPSGEGKTTILRILLGLILPQQGTAELIGESGLRYTLSAGTRTAFGYVPQGNQIFSGTVAENLRVSSPDATDEELIEVLKVACAYEFVMALPGGLDHVIGGRDKRLSEGQAQRLAVARALLQRAPILLLDEATSALDMELESQLLKNLMESGMVHTCILVTHRPAGKALCSRSYYIRDGGIREETT